VNFVPPLVAQTAPGAVTKHVTGCAAGGAAAAAAFFFLAASLGTAEPITNATAATATNVV